MDKREKTEINVVELGAANKNDKTVTSKSMSEKKYNIKGGLVYQSNKKENFEICGEVTILGKTYSAEIEEYGIFVQFKTDNKSVSVPITNRQLQEPKKLCAMLSSLGLHVVPTKHPQISDYLNHLARNNKKTYSRTLKPGWVNEKIKSYFVLPDEIIGSNDVIYQPEQHDIKLTTVQSKGTLKQWKDNLVTLCIGNHKFIFSLCAGLAAPLLNRLKMSSVGFHFSGASGSGKTTQLQITATLFGNGSLPGSMTNAYTQTWGTTGNAIEATAASHNDLPLILDELGMSKDSHFGSTVYALIGGKSKQRMTQDITMRKPMTWTNVVISSGEISMADSIEAKGGIVRAGQLVRMIEISINKEGLNIHENKNPKEFIDKIKYLCSEYYGCAGPEFIKALIKDKSIDLTKELEECTKNLTGCKINISSDHQRVIGSFSLLMLAGRLANKYNIINIATDNAIKQVADEYLNNMSIIKDSIRGAKVLQDFIFANPGRFRMKEFEDGKVKDLVGFTIGQTQHHEKVKTNKEIIPPIQIKEPTNYLFIDEPLKLILKGFDYKMVMEEIKSMGFLEVDKMRPGGLNSKLVRIAGMSKAKRFYSIKADFMGHEIGTNDTD